MTSALRRLRRPVTSADVTASLREAYGPYLRPYRRSLVGMAVGSFLAGMTEAGLLVVLASLAVSIGGVGDLEASLGPLGDLDLSIGQMFAIAAALALARTVFQVLVAHISAAMTRDLVVSIRAQMFADYTRAGWPVQADEDEATVQDLLGRHVNRTTTAVGLVAQALGSVFGLVALLLSAFVVDPLAAALIIVSGAFLFVVLRPLTVLAKRMARVQLEAGRRFAQKGFEAVGLSLEVRAFGVDDEVAAELDEVARRRGPARLLLQLPEPSGDDGLPGGGGDGPAHRPGGGPHRGLAAPRLPRCGRGHPHPLAQHGGHPPGPLPQPLRVDPVRRASPHRAGEVPRRGAAHRHGREQGARAPPLRGGRLSVPLGRDGPDGRLLLDRARRGGGAHRPVGERQVHPHPGAPPAPAPRPTARIASATWTRPRSTMTTWFRRIAFVPQDCRVFNGTIADNIRFFRPRRHR